MIRFLVLFLSLSRIALGQIATFGKIERKNPITKEVYTFPKIIMPEAKSVSDIINFQLQSDMLGVDSGVKEDNIFNKVWRTIEQTPTFSDIEYEVIYNNNFILSLSISGQGCGAYCEETTNYFVFNLKTGRNLSLDSLFSKEGLIRIVDCINELRHKEISVKIKNIKDTLSLSYIQKDNAQLEQYGDMLKLYEECRDMKIELKYLNLQKFIVMGKKVTVITDRCSNHYNMNIDDLWYFRYHFLMENYKYYLTDYGRSIFQY